jgi:hypothetical protein
MRGQAEKRTCRTPRTEQRSPHGIGRTAQIEQDCQDSCLLRASSTRLLKKGTQGRTDWRGQPELDRKNETTGLGQSEKKQSEQDKQNRTSRTGQTETGLLGRDCQAMLGQDSQGRTAGTRQWGQDSQKRRARQDS